MNYKERQDIFIEQLKTVTKISDNWVVNKCFGISNSSIVIEGGLFYGGPNYANVTSERIDIEGFAIISIVRFPPEDEVYFASLIQSEKEQFKQRLNLMSTMALQGDTQYAQVNNNVKVYLTEDGKIFLRNKGFWNSLKDPEEFVSSTAGPSARIDKLLYAVYPPSSSAQRSLLAREFIGYLARFIGRERVHEIQPWPDIDIINEKMARSPADIPIDEIKTSIYELGGYYIDDIVERFHVAVNHLKNKHFVILKGLSGTGKTSLIRRYALAVHGIKNPKRPDPLLFECPVRPDWTDPAGLVGYYDMISNRYSVPTFLEAVLTAIKYPNSPVFICLDEMNIARVEYYFSDILSAMESDDPRLKLHPHSTPLEGSTGGEITSSLPFPSNIYIIGTVNIDETTHPISDKVLDRAVVIDLSKVDMGGYIDRLQSRNTDLTRAADCCKEILTSVYSIVEPHGLAFGYRIAEEFIRYIDFAMKPSLSEDLSEKDLQTKIIDHVLVQKVLVKLRGTERQRPMLEKLKSVFSEFPRSKESIQQMLIELDEQGAFQFCR